MKTILFGLFGLLSLGIFAQEKEVDEEFLPISIEGKDAFMSTKTGEYTFLEHAKTDPTQLKTTASGVVYTDVSMHTIKKGETLYAIAKENKVSVDEIKKHNKGLTSKLKVGTPLKIVKNLLIKSSSPVISYAGETRELAKLRPGETPGQFARPPSVAEVESQVIKMKKSEEKPSKTKYKAQSSVKNPIFALENDVEEAETEDEAIDKLSEALKEEAKSVKSEEKSEEIVAVVSEKKEVLKVEEIETKEEIVEEVKQAVTEIVKKKTKEEVAELKTETEIEEITKKPSEEEIEDATSETVESEEGVKYHKVVKGNTLYSISKTYKTTVKALKALNNLKTNVLSVGQKLKVIPNKK